VKELSQGQRKRPRFAYHNVYQPQFAPLLNLSGQRYVL
jgi:hypothetical protein